MRRRVTRHSNTQLAAPVRELEMLGTFSSAARTFFCCRTMLLSSSRHMAQVMPPRLRSQMELSAARDTPGLFSGCRRAETPAPVCLLARPARSVQVSSGSLYNEQAAARYAQAAGSSSGSTPAAVQGGLFDHPSATCQLPLQQGICNERFGPHAYPPKTAAAEPKAILAEDLTPEELYRDHIPRIAEVLFAPCAGYIGYSRNPNQEFRPLPHKPESILVMTGGELVDDLRGILKTIVPNGPILYTFTAQYPGEDWKTLLYIGQSGQGLTRMLSYCQEDDGFFGDSQDSLKMAYMLDLAARGFNIEVQFVEVPAPEALEKGVLEKIDIYLNTRHNRQVREPRFLVPLSEIIPKHPEKARKADQIRRHIKEVEKMLKPVLQTLLIKRFGRAAAEVKKLRVKKLRELWRQVSIGWRDRQSLFAIAMTDFQEDCSPENIIQYNIPELQTAYYAHYGRLPHKMSKNELLQEVLELSSRAAASDDHDAGCQDLINNVQERRIFANPYNIDVLPVAAAHSHPIGSTSSTTCSASNDCDIQLPTPGRRRRKVSKARGSSAVSAVNVSKSNNSQQQVTDSKNATSAGDEELSDLHRPVLRGLVVALCGSDAAKPQKKLTKDKCLALLEGKLPKQGTKAASATVAMSSFLDNITPDSLRATTRPILDAFYYISQGRVVTSKEMKIDQLRDFLLRKINDRPSILNLPSMNVNPLTPQDIKPSNRRRQSKKKAAKADKKSMPKGTRDRRTTQKHQHLAFI